MQHDKKSQIHIQKEEKSFGIFVNGENKPFDSYLHDCISKGMEIYEITENIFPTHHFLWGVDPMVLRFFNIMCGYHDDFITFLSRFYPFTFEMLKRHQEVIKWEELLNNEFLDWTEELLIEIRDNWCRHLDVQNSNVGSSILISVFKSCPFETLSASVKKEFDTEESFISKVFNMGFIREFHWHHFDTKMSRLKEDSDIYSDSPKDLEEILLQIEQNGLNNDYEKGKFHRYSPAVESLISLFNCENPRSNGFEYIFNTPEKRLILDSAVMLFLVELTHAAYRQEIRKEIDNSIIRIKGEKI